MSDLGWIDDWMPTIDGIRTKEKKSKLPGFIQDKIDAKKEEDGEEEKSGDKPKDVKKKT